MADDLDGVPATSTSKELLEREKERWILDNEKEKEKHARDLIRGAIANFQYGMYLGLVGIIAILSYSSFKGTLTSDNKLALGIATGFVALMALLHFWLVLYRLTSVTGVHEPDGHGRTSKTLAYYVMAAFVLGLIGIFIAAQFAPVYLKEIPESARTWIDIFRNGFVLLGTALTTIIGFYFGSKQGEQAQRQLKEVTQDLRDANSLIQRQSSPPKAQGNPSLPNPEESSAAEDS